MKLSEITCVPFLLLDDKNNPYVTEDLLNDWDYSDDILMPVFELCKWGYVLGTLKPNIKCECGCNDIYRMNDKYMPYKCKKCKRKFNVFTDTVFNNKKYDFRYYEVIYENNWSWKEIVYEGYFTNVTYYKLKNKF